MIGWVLATGLLAAAPEVLSLEQALAHAEAHDARAGLLDLDEQIAAISVGRAVGDVLPTATLDASILRNAREVKIGSGADERVVVPLLVPGAGATVRTPLFNGTGVPGIWEQAQRYRATTADVAEQRDGLLHDVAGVYLDLAEAEALLGSLRRSQDVLSRLVEIEQARVELGEATSADSAAAQSELLRLQAVIEDARGQRTAAHRWLALYTGLDPEQPAQTHCVDCVSLPDAPSTEHRTDLLALERAAFADRVGEAARWLTFLPTVDAVGDVQLSQPTLFRPEPIWWTARLVASWELFSGGRTATDAALQNRRATRAEQAATFARNEAETLVRAARARADAASRLREAEKARVTSTELALDLGQARHREGLMSSADMLLLTSRRVDAETAAVRAEFAHYRAILQVRQAQGLGPLTTGNSP